MPGKEPTPLIIPSVFDIPIKGAIFPGAVVMIAGINKSLMPSLIVKVHAPGVVMTDLDGEEIVWPGIMPIIDVIIVNQRGGYDGIRDDNNNPLGEWIGDPVLATKVCWQGDLQRRGSLKHLPRHLVNVAPRYILVTKLEG